MSIKLYPIFLKLENISCCVIGGGAVALRKVKSLLESRARVTVVSPELCAGLKSLKKKKLFIHEKHKYQKKFIRGKFLVIAATNDARVNKKAAVDAKARKILVNVVDVPSECNFYVPAVLHKNGISIAISTQGAFPGISRKIKEENWPVLKKYAKSLKRLAVLRKDIYASDKTCKKKKLFIKSLIRPDVLEMIKNKKNCNINDLKAYLEAL
ncbi:MAG: bifunctional precorrin-2 dehydrogenase/sirohydrochlorin ferrochelatase [Candidatus Omnitrophota bacterium]